MPAPTLDLRTQTAVYSPPRPPADRRLSDVRRVDQHNTHPTYPSREQWEARRAELRQQILCAAGLWPEPPRTPLHAVHTGRQERDGYSVENVAFQSRPGFYVTGNLYRPLGPAERRPALLCPHGHSRKGRLEHGETISTIARCISFARQGYVAFAYDMVGYNDARQIPHQFGGWQDWLWSLGALGLQLWNSIRAVDYLLTLPDVDPDRLGSVGESGGGTQTFLLSAVDDRVGFLAPVVMVSAHFQGGCVCENIPNLRLDTFNVEIAAMAAPRPMTLVSATGDWTANTPSVEYPAIRSIYALYGKEHRLSQTQITAPHNFNQASREAVYRFFAHWFRGTPLDQPLPEEPLEPAPEETLRVFSSALPTDALDADGVRAIARDLAEQQLSASWPADAASLARFRDGLGAAYRLALDTHPVGPDGVVVQRLGEQSFDTYGAVRLLIGRGRATMAPTTGRGGPRPQVDCLPAIFFPVSDSTKDRRPVVIAHGAGKAALFTERDGQAVPGELLAALLAEGRAVLLFDAFLTGDYLTPVAASGRDQTGAHFTTFNRSDAALRVQDVVTAVAAARQLTGAAAVDLVGLADGGLWALLARPLAAGVATLVADGAGFDWQSDRAYMEQLYIPGLRRAGGLATALVLAAPGTTSLFQLRLAGQAERVPGLYSALGADGQFIAQAQAASATQIVGWLTQGQRA